MSTTGIYVIMNTASDRCYVGSAVNIARRRGQHFIQLGRGVHCNQHLQRAWNKHGRKSFTFDTVLSCYKEYLLWFEQCAINGYSDLSGWKCLYNIQPVAGSPLGVKHSPEHRKRNGDARRGKPLCPETRAKMADSRIGKRASDETRAKMSATRKGRKCKTRTAEHNARIGAAKKGKPLSPEHSAKISAGLKGKCSSERMSRTAHARWARIKTI